MCANDFSATVGRIPSVIDSESRPDWFSYLSGGQPAVIRVR